jgi:hypothetical protein
VDTSGRVAVFDTGTDVETFTYCQAQGNTSEHLCQVKVNGTPYRTYQHEDDLLVAVYKGEQEPLLSADYYPQGDPTAPAYIRELQTSSEDIREIEYGLTSELPRPVQPWAEEFVTRVTSESGAAVCYYMRPMMARYHRVVDARDCGMAEGSFASFAFDRWGRVVRKQGHDGYVTTWEYGPWGDLVQTRSGLLPAGCVPGPANDYCRVEDTDELARISLDGPAS